MTTVKAQLAQVRSIVHEDVAKLMQRGERIEHLMQRSHQLELNVLQLLLLLCISYVNN